MPNSLPNSLPTSNPDWRTVLRPQQWWPTARRAWRLAQIRDPSYRFLFAPSPPNEWVALDCETTGLNVRTDEIISIGAVRIAGNRILTSERLELLIKPEREVSAQSVKIHRLRARDLASGLPAHEAIQKLLHFIGSRPLVGYYLEFDVAMLNRLARPLLGQGLPQPRIEVSSMYYDYQFRHRTASEQYENPEIDLRFSTMMNTLQLPLRDAHDALNDAVMAALAFIKLRQLTESR